MSVEKVCVYCASSDKIDVIYKKAAEELGCELANNGIEVVSGGGKIGLMGLLANGALNNGGKITGIIPRFMLDNGWGHSGLTDLIVVDTMHDRKRKMIECSDAFIALPGGYGTLEELLETITWRQLKLHKKPVVIVNLNNFFDDLLNQFGKCMKDNFMDSNLKSAWISVNSVHNAVEHLCGRYNG